jgi:hypothetical protein
MKNFVSQIVINKILALHKYLLNLKNNEQVNTGNSKNTGSTFTSTGKYWQYFHKYWKILAVLSQGH